MNEDTGKIVVDQSCTTEDLRRQIGGREKC